MDKSVESVVNELATTLAALRSAGEIGFLILVVFLLIVIALAVIAVVYQRIVISRFQVASKATEETFKSVNAQLQAVDAQIKAIDSAIKERELSIKERDELRNIFTQQFSLVKDANTELRTEIDHLREQQTGLENSLNATITAGLQDIRERLTQTSVKEIIAQVPETFRNDLETEFNKSLQAAISRINQSLQDKDVMHEYITAVTEKLRGEVNDIIPEYIKHFDPRMITEAIPDIIYHEILDATRDHNLAELAARRASDRIRERYEYYRRRG